MERTAARSRPWIIVAIALIVVKFSLVVLYRTYFAEWRLHAVPDMPEVALGAVWWLTRVTPPAIVAAMVLDSIQQRNKVAAQRWAILFVIVTAYVVVATIGITHGWWKAPY